SQSEPRLVLNAAARVQVITALDPAIPSREWAKPRSPRTHPVCESYAEAVYPPCRTERRCAGFHPGRPLCHIMRLGDRVKQSPRSCAQQSPTVLHNLGQNLVGTRRVVHEKPIIAELIVDGE